MSVPRCLNKQIGDFEIIEEIEREIEEMRTSTVGLPRLSKICLALTVWIVAIDAERERLREVDEYSRTERRETDWEWAK